MQLIFEKSVKDRKGLNLPKSDVSSNNDLPSFYLREKEPQLPEVSELDVVRHFTNLSRKNFSVDTNFYPLGSCTMKYNPKFTEKIANFANFTEIHPLLPQIQKGDLFTQGSLEIIYETERLLCEITGMNAFTMQPFAGAHGELTGIILISHYHKFKGNYNKKYIIVSDSSHGTNPASAAIGGFEIITVSTDTNGYMNLEEFKSKLNKDVAAVMLTCPDTLGIFNPSIKKICDLAHEVDALMYYDGANFNAILGKCRPGDIGFDVIHLNLHKTFSTPHGGGGPGSGPVGVNEKLISFLPVPQIIKNENKFFLNYDFPNSIGSISSFYGNFLVVLKTYAYILLLGKEGLIKTSEIAVLNANYCKELLKEYFYLPYDKICMHECVFSASKQKEENHITALDIAKYLIDKGIHPPTIYFPLIVKEAMMIEPTETESKQTLDNFINVMKEIADLAKSNPEKLKQAPINTPVKRLDETKAARELNLRWEL